MPKRLPLTNFLWMFSEHSIVILSNLVVSIVLARSLGAQGFGVLSACLAFVGLFLPLFQVGLNGLLVKEVVNRNLDYFVLVNGLTLRVVSTITFGIVAFMVCLTIPALADYPAIIAILILGHIGLSGVISEQWFHARKCVRKFSTIRSAVLFVFAIGKSLVAVYSGQLIYIAMLYCAENVMLGTLTWFAFAKQQQVKQPNPKISYLSRLLKKGSWLVLSSLAAVVYLKIDQVMIFQMLGDGQTGVYAVAAKIAEVAYFLPTILVAVLFPYLIEKAERSKHTFKQDVRQYMSGLFYLSLTVSVVCVAVSPFILPVLFGEEYTPAVAVLNIYIWSSVFVFMRALVSRILIIEDLLPFSLVSHSIGALLNVLLNLWWIPEYGIIGAAYATLFAYVGGAFLVFFMFKRTRWFAISMLLAPFWPLQKLMK